MSDPVEKRLPLTPEQVTLLQGLEAATQLAMSRTQLAVQVVVAGHGISAGEFRGMDLSDPAAPVLVVLVPGMLDGE